MSSAPSFSLVAEPWIACQLSDERDALLSLRNVFDGSVRIAGIRGDSPTQNYAVERLLLAIFWRAHHRETEVAPGETFDFDAWREDAWFEATSGDADDAVLAYLTVHQERFDLLHPLHPFMQVPDLQTTKDSRLPIARIIPEAESDYFTMRAGEALASISPAEAARWVIHTQAYDYSGIKSGAIGDPRVKGGKGYPIGTGWSGMTGGTTILGSTLRETLVLNTTADALDGGERDRPIWERAPDGPAERPVLEPAGAADLATWQARRIRLFTEDDRIVSVLVSNGDPIPKAGANEFGDPMTPYRFSKNKSTKASQVFYPRPYDTNRLMWRSLEPLIALEGDVQHARGEYAGKRPRTLDALSRVRASGLGEQLRVLNVRLTSASYGPQSSSAATSVDARIDIPQMLLNEQSRPVRQAVLDTARVTLTAAVALGSFGGRLLVAAGGEYVFQSDATDSLLAELEPEFRDWLRRFDPQDLEEASRQWQRGTGEKVRERAQVLLRGAGPKALIGREVTQNDRTSLVTAGTAYTQLQRDLHKALPLLKDKNNDLPTRLSEEEPTDNA